MLLEHEALKNNIYTYLSYRNSHADSSYSSNIFV